MAKKHVVAKGRALHFKGQVIEEGTDVTGIGVPNMADHLKSGFVVELDGPDPLPDASGTFVPPLAADQNLEGKGEKLQTIGKWALDPKTLKDKSLDQLNVMVRERDSSLAPFESVAEAVARLTSDFKPAPAPKPAKK